jgi:hypothetical protein
MHMASLRLPWARIFVKKLRRQLHSMVFSGATECVMKGGSNMGNIIAGLVRKIYGRVKVQILFINKHCVERL